MTNEEKEILEPMIRSIMEKSKGHATDEEVAKALEMLGTLADHAAESIYCYEHPDYGAMVKDVPEFLRPLFSLIEVAHYRFDFADGLLYFGRIIFHDVNQLVEQRRQMCAQHRLFAQDFNRFVHSPALKP